MTTIGQAVRAEMVRLEVDQVEIVKLGDGRMIYSESDPTLNEPLGNHTFQLLNWWNGKGEPIQVDSPVGQSED